MPPAIKLPLPAPWGYAVACTGLVVATGVRFALQPFLGSYYPFFSYLFLVLLTTWACRLGPSVLTLVLGGVAAWFFFLPPLCTLKLPDPVGLTGLVLYITIGAVSIAITEAQRHAGRRLVLEMAETERARAALRESEDHYRDSVELSPQLPWIADAQGHITDFSHRWLELTGLSRDVALGQGWQLSVHPDDLALMIEAWSRSIQTGAPYDIEHRIRLATGGYRWMRSRAFPRRDPSGQIVRWFGNTEDIHDRKSAEEQLRLSEATLRAFYDNSPLCMGIVEPTRNDVLHLYDNPATCHFFGVEPGQTASRLASQLNVNPKVLSLWLSHYQQSQSTGRPVHFDHEYQSPTGPRWLSVTVSPIGPGPSGLDRFCYIAEDITDRKRAEQLLAESESRFRSAAEAVNGFIYEYEFESGRVTVSTGVESLLGLPPEELTNLESWNARIHPDDLPRIKAESQRSLESGARHYQNEYRVLHNQGTHLWVWDNALAERNAEGKVVRVVGHVIDVTDRKRAEAEQIESQNTLFTLVEQCPFGIYIVDDEFRIASVNAGSQHTAFANVRPLIGRPFDEAMRILWPEPLATECINIFRHTLETGEPYSSRDFISPRADTHQTEGYEWELHRITLPGGRRGVVCYYFDSTRLRRVERELREAEQRLRTMADNAPMLIWQTDEQGATFLSRHYLDFFNRPADELLGMGWAQFLHPDDAEGYITSYRSAFERRARYTHTCRCRRHDGEYRWFLSIGSPLFTPDGEFAGFVGCSLDVTDTKRAEDRQRLLSEAAAVLLATDDPNDMLRGVFEKIAPHFGLDLYFNFMVDDPGTALRLVSYAGIPEETARNIDRLEFGQAVCGNVAITQQPICVCHIQQSDDPKVQLVKSFGVRAYACNPIKAAGTLLGTLSFASRSRDEFDPAEIEFLKTVCQYVTAAYERLRLIRRLRDEDRRKDEFLAMLAHELRNPLAPIRNAVSIMSMAESDRDAQRWAREVIDRQARHLSSLVDDLLDISRITQGKITLTKTPLPLTAFLNSAVESSRPLIESRRHQLEVQLGDEPMKVSGDLTRLSQVVLNLLINAAKYTPEGGRIELSVRRVEGRCRISIRDNGEGIASETLPTVFDLFTQAQRSLDRSQGGLGIGLTIVKRLVEMHGGTVEAFSDGPGKGSEFVVNLPLITDETTPRRPSAQPHRAAPASDHIRRILIVDDSTDARESLHRLLESLGHHVENAHDGPSSIDAALRGIPDLVLLDIGLPGMDGYEVARRMRREPALDGVYLVALTGYGSESDRQRSFAAGLDDHLVKPVEFSALLRILNKTQVARS